MTITERETNLHAAVCRAVTVLAVAPEVARIPEGREVRDILRQALVDYADDFMDQPTTEAEQGAMRELHSGRTT